MNKKGDMEISQNKSIVEQAFQKLQSSLYFEKQNLQLRHKMVEFCSKGIKNQLDDLEGHLLNPAYNFQSELGKIGLFFLPKKLENKDGKTQGDNLICNDYRYEENVVKRLMIYADIPIELHIIAVMWLMKFGPKLDEQLDKYCWGNRLIIDSDTHEIKEGRWLYKPYQRQYQQWWSKATEEANHLLENAENVCILNLDIQNYFHSVRIGFDELKVEMNVDEEDERLWNVFVDIHKKYNEVFAQKGFRETDFENGYALPVGLRSSSVLGNWYLKGFDEQVNEELSPAYYGRYVDDILVVTKSSKKPEKIEDFIEKLSIGLKKDEKDNSWRLMDYPTLKLQQEKMFLYFFDTNYSTELLSKFEKEQKERSSEFRFLSDEEDVDFNDDFMDFESCFDEMSDSKARFKPQSENKFKLACYLAKFIRRRLERGKDYEKKKEKQIRKYFKGSILISHYYFWEKLFTLYVISEDDSAIVKLYKSIKKSIERLKIEKIEWWRELSIGKEEIKENLIEYLNNALVSAMSVEHKGALDKPIKDLLGMKDDETPSSKDYRSFHFNRSHYEKRILAALFDKEYNNYKLESNNLIELPYDVKLSEITYAAFHNSLNDKTTGSWNSVLEGVLETVKDKWKPEIQISRERVFFNTERADEKEKCSDLITVVCVNQLVMENALRDSRRGKRKLSSAVVETYENILDKLTKIGDYDMFVMPELSLPWDMLQSFMRFSANQQVGFVAGMEYLNINNTVYNFVLTCVPFEKDHVRDCLPVFRLKKYYAPKEEDTIRAEAFELPERNSVKLNLFEWKGMRFTVFNCYELTNESERAKFVSEIDAMFVVAYNKDVNYYDSLAEETCRDLHCYVVLNNISQYGNSQVIAPLKSEFRTLLKTVRGTTLKNLITTEIAEFNIKELRLFQKYQQQNKDKSIKPLPAGYNRNNERLNFL